MTRVPTRAIAGNVRWTRSGAVWADWILSGVPYGLRPVKDKQSARGLHQALVRSLPGESLMLGICAGLDPAVVVTRMLEDVDLEDCPEWVAECEATLDSLDEMGIGQRVFWLSVPLSAEKTSDRWLEPARAAMSGLRDHLGLPRTSIPQEEIQRRLQQATRVAEGIPAPFKPSAATAAQMVWLHEHSLRRGLYQDMDLPLRDDAVADSLLTPRSGTALTEPILDEGGMSDLDRGVLGRTNLVKRRFLKVTDPWGVSSTTPSYQALLAVSEVPDGGMVFPGSEIIGRIDEAGIDVDWAMRLTVRASSEVDQANRRALRNLNEQYGQRSGEASHAVNTLDRAAAELAEYAGLLESDKLEVEVQATMMFAVGAPDPEGVRVRTRALSDFFAETGHKLVTPLGDQSELWWAMHPGVPSSRVVRELAQITTSRDISALVPFASVHLGDSKGTLLGLNIAHGPMLATDVPCGPTSVVFHDLEGASDRQISGSLAVAGELGAGKTATLMKLAGDVVDRAGHLVIADRTKKGEWADWAKTRTSAVVVNVADPHNSLDPLRILPLEEGSRAMAAFLAPLLDIKPTSPRGVVISEVLDPTYLAEHHLDSAGALLEHLARHCKIDEAKELARLIRVFSRQSFGRVIFDESLPAVDLKSRAIVVRTHSLLLPSREELNLKHLFDQLGLDKIYGRAFNAMLASLARHICFEDTSTLAGYVVSEAHSMTISFEGERELVDFVRDGRKHRAVVMLDSHDPEADFGSPTLRGLIPTRLLMRHRDKTMAQHGLRWLDLDPTDEDLINLVTENTSPVPPQGSDVLAHRRGEATMRDMSGNLGRIKILLPARDDVAAAITAGGTAAARKNKVKAAS